MTLSKRKASDVFDKMSEERWEAFIQWATTGAIRYYRIDESGDMYDCDDEDDHRHGSCIREIVIDDFMGQVVSCMSLLPYDEKRAKTYTQEEAMILKFSAAEGWGNVLAACAAAVRKLDEND